MTEIQQQPNLTPDIVKGRMSVALTKVGIGIQALHDMEAKLVYNEDHLEEVKNFIETTKKALKVIEAEHKTIKEPYWKECVTIDASKRELDASVNMILIKAQQKYTAMCKAIEERKKKQDAENARIAAIKDGIAKNMVAFATQIAEAKTLAELTKVESNINLQKTRTTVYQEFLPDAITQFNTLTASIKQQKKTLTELEQLRKKAEKATDDSQLIEMQEKEEELKNRLEENKVNVQLGAIDGATSQVAETVTEVIPEVKAKRSVWKYEAVDINLLLKKMPHLVTLILNDEKVKDLLATKKADGSLDGKEEEIINGLRFYLDKSY